MKKLQYSSDITFNSFDSLSEALRGIVDKEFSSLDLEYPSQDTGAIARDSIEQIFGQIKTSALGSNYFSADDLKSDLSDHIELNLSSHFNKIYSPEAGGEIESQEVSRKSNEVFSSIVGQMSALAQGARDVFIMIAPLLSALYVIRSIKSPTIISDINSFISENNISKGSYYLNVLEYFKNRINSL